MAREDGFLARWSRRKREAAQTDAPAPLDAEARRDGGAELDALVPVPADPAPADHPHAESGKEAFDIGTLPSVETLTDQSDIRDFLRKGVPEQLKNAALRKVWAADPYLRNFGGPGEYAWDFNDPDSIPGFSSARPDFDLVEHARMVTGHAKPAPAPGPAEDISRDAPARLPPGEPVHAAAHDAIGTEADEPRVEATGNAAPQEENVDQTALDEMPIAEPFQDLARRRRHGGAVPD